MTSSLKTKSTKAFWRPDIPNKLALERAPASLSEGPSITDKEVEFESVKMEENEHIVRNRDDLKAGLRWFLAGHQKEHSEP